MQPPTTRPFGRRVLSLPLAECEFFLERYPELGVTRPIDGQPASISDADGRVTRFGYDGFGLLTATYYGPVGDLRQPSAFQGIRPCGPSAGGEPCPAGATAVRIQLAAGSPEVRTYVDGLGREVAVETQLRDVQGQDQVNGPQYNRVETHYNERGLVEWSSQPQAIQGWGQVYSTDSWVPTYRRQVAGYDVLGRPGSVTEPRQLPDNSGAAGGNQKTTYTYDGLRTDIKVQEEKNGSLQGTALTMSRQVDALGRPVLTTDASRCGVRSSIDAKDAVRRAVARMPSHRSTRPSGPATTTTIR
jgi:hypothetical protein